MLISLIVARSENGVIGVSQGLPWHLSGDLRHFKATTMGKPIVMGRKTHESIGRALPGRMNIVVTRNLHFAAEGCVVVNSLEEALEIAAPATEIMVIGGGQLYRQTLATASRIYLTEVHVNLLGDTFLEGFDLQDWQEIEREFHSRDEQNEYDYSFVVLERRQA